MTAIFSMGVRPTSGRSLGVFRLLAFSCIILYAFLPLISKDESWTSVRLPDYIHPLEYSIELSLTDTKFRGNVSISLAIEKETDFVVVHNEGNSVVVNSMTGLNNTYPVSYINVNERQQYLVIHFKQRLMKGEYLLLLSYEGILRQDMQGFYSSKYVKSDGSEHMLATTHFEATSARMAFPCLDEPDKKAVFLISIETQKKYHAISNMPVKAKKDLGSYTRFEFQPTVKMSSYLVAFIVSDFDRISSKTSNGIAVSVYTPPESTKLGRYALKSAVGILEFYQNQYGIDFPLPKCDLVAIPDRYGAMENWGLILFQDINLLYDDENPDSLNKQRVAEVVGI